MRNTGLEEAQAGIKTAGRNINNLRYADDTTLMAESEELKSLLMKVKSLSCVWLFATPWMVAYQASLSMGFSRQEYWSDWSSDVCSSDLKQGDNIQPWRTPFPIWNQSVVPCPVLTVASWPAYRFLKRQVRWSGIPISFRIFHSWLWSTQSKALAQSIKQK